LRYLEKIIFINSASIPFEEVMLDGNVHLIGTQGVGKSTILRAILFFYNGDTQKLGIPKEKKPFAEYYFPHTNSYILYEVKRQSGNFTILAMRSGPGIAFRFIDAPFERQWLISEQRARDSWGDIRSLLDQNGIDYSNKIDRQAEYRDIIYGNTNAKKQYRKYALLESKQYQSIPRTISNVFLNAKLEADHIKQTIINSLSEEPLTIDLSRYQHHLADFDREYYDVQKFKEAKAREQADAIVEHYNAILHQKEELSRKADQLHNGLQKAEAEQQRLNREISEQTAAKEETQRKLADARKRHEQQRDRYNGTIKSLDQQIKKARQKEQEYREKGIEEIVQRVEQKQQWLNEQQRLHEERNTLTTKFQSIEESYNVRINQLRNNRSQLENERDAEKNEASRHFYEQKQKAQTDKEQKVQQQREELKQNLAALEDDLNKAQEKKTALREQRSELNARQLYADEINECDQSIHQAESRLTEIEAAIKLQKSEIGQLQKDWQNEEEARQSAKEQQLADLQKEKEQKEDQQKDVQQKLDRYQSTFYGFLKENYPEWEETIGKVCREDVLFSEDVNPNLKGSERLLYGVAMDLDNLNTSAKTLANYEQEAKALNERIEAINQERQQVEQQCQEDLNKLKKRYQPKIRACKDQIQQLEVEQSNKNRHIEECKLNKEELQQKAGREKQEHLTAIDEQIAETDQQISELRDKQKAEQERFEKNSKQRESDLKKQVKQLHQNWKDAVGNIDQKYQERLEDIDNRLNDLNSQKEQALQEAGADTERLQQLDERLAELSNELQFIEQWRDEVARYRKDKDELIDHVGEMKEQRTGEKQKLERAEERFAERKKEYEEQITQQDDELKALQKQVEQIEQGFSEFEGFSKSDFFINEIQPEMGQEQETGDPFSVPGYIQQVRDVQNDLLMRQEKLKETVNRYLSRFNDVNLFKFRTNLIDQRDYLAFAADLKEFVDYNKIEELERRVNERFANILNQVAKETGDLINKEGEIQNVISRINKDFRERNFVGVISSIELKMEESAEQVVRLLKDIREFEQEKGFALGEANLFNQDQNDQQNERAVALLRQLNQDIRDTRKEQITLSDAFDLRFRVAENENDTGWVEKLSHVGSEGTDILVKAMINIMLLNVFKESASQKFKDFKLHCMMDEIGRLHPGNVQGILKFANDRNILLINGSPVVQDAMAYRHIYELRKTENMMTRVKRLLSVETESPEEAPVS